ncbi:MAG: hypothetical protein R3D67_09395 [Hyphomicrobiaceae bacterium]
MIETTRITKVLAFRGLERTSIDEAHAGDIVAIAGVTEATVAGLRFATRRSIRLSQPSPSILRRWR